MRNNGTFLVTLLLDITLFIQLIRYIATNRESIFFWEYDSSCNHDEYCIRYYLSGAIPMYDSDFLQILREDHLWEPSAQLLGSNHSNNHPLPRWDGEEYWSDVQKKLSDIWQKQPPGVFVEIGAVDGFFRSHSLYLERNFNWTGLLIEPDQRSFELMKKRGRNAWLSDLCIEYDFPGVRGFWMKAGVDDLSYGDKLTKMAESKLNAVILEEEFQRGDITWRLCVPLSSLLISAGFTEVDELFLYLETIKHLKMIKDVLNSQSLDIKTILIEFPRSGIAVSGYHEIEGYILDMNNSQYLYKFYVKKTHCKLIQREYCRVMKHYDKRQGCVQYLCLNGITVWSYD